MSLSKMILFFCCFFAFSSLKAQNIAPMPINENENFVLTFETDKGNIKLFLLNETPKHRNNIVKLAKSGFYNGIAFHRVINNFMIQVGDPTTKKVKNPKDLSNRTIEAEIIPDFHHYRGAVAAAREDDKVNPTKRSSYCQFYIVQNPAQNAKMAIGKAKNKGKEFSEEVETLYFERGGTPHLDYDYTVFGYVLEGIEVVDAIAQAPQNDKNRPLEDIRIKKVTVSKELRENIDKNYNHYGK